MNDYDNRFTNLSKESGKNDNKSTWNSLSSIYCEHFKNPTVQFFIDELISDIDKDKIIMEYGCSSGMNLNYLKEQGYLNLMGIDISEVAIKYGVDNFKLENIWVDDYTKPSNKDVLFDVVFSRATLQHVDETELINCLKNFYRLLSDDGEFIFSECFEPIIFPIGRIVGHRVYNTFNHDWNRVLIECGFKIIKNKRLSNEHVYVKCKKM